MNIQHDKKNYSLNIELVVRSGDDWGCVKYGNALEFSEAMAFEYPGINFDSVVKLYNEWLNKINQWISKGGVYMESWRYVNIYVGVVGSEVIVSMKQDIIKSKIDEKIREYKTLSDGLIAKIVCYGWEVFNNQDKKMPKICYYSKNGDDSQTYDIYVYRDRLILMNADRSKPSILTGQYFLYNAGEKKKG